jgi:hypothetical protein
LWKSYEFRIYSIFWNLVKLRHYHFYSRYIS